MNTALANLETELAAAFANGDTAKIDSLLDAATVFISETANSPALAFTMVELVWHAQADAGLYQNNVPNPRVFINEGVDNDATARG